MYTALGGNGANVRLVTLPYEAHAYRGEGSVEHTLYEVISWFDRYLRGDDARARVESMQSF